MRRSDRSAFGKVPLVNACALRISHVYRSVFGRADVECVAETVAKKIKRKKRERKERARKYEEPPKFLHLFRAVFDEHTPGAHRRLHSKSEEAEKCLEQ